MSLQTWSETLVSAQVDGSALTASTTATSIIPAAAKVTLPAGYFQIGRVLRLRAAGRVSNVVTSPGTLTLDVRLGAVIAANGGAISLNVVAKTNVAWTLDWLLTCRAIGNGTVANLMHQGEWKSESIIGANNAATGVPSWLLPSATPAVGTGFDSTTSQTVDLFATWGTNNANSIQVHQYTLEAMN
jgi:hypothetical protein